MIINYYIKKQLSEFPTQQGQLEFLQSIIEFCRKTQYIIQSNMQIPHVEVVISEDTQPEEENLNNE